MTMQLQVTTHRFAHYIANVSGHYYCIHLQDYFDLWPRKAVIRAYRYFKEGTEVLVLVLFEVSVPKLFEFRIIHFCTVVTNYNNVLNFCDQTCSTEAFSIQMLGRC